jgi:hypothetical protein
MRGLLKNLQTTKTFHVAMLQRHKGFWDSAGQVLSVVAGGSLKGDDTVDKAGGVPEICGKDISKSMKIHPENNTTHPENNTTSWPYLVS